MIIFGWGGGRPTNHGGAVPITCPNCINETVLQYTTTTQHFSLFWIPLIPYGKKHFLLCPICTRGRQLTAAQGGHAMTMTNSFRAWTANQVSDDQFVNALNNFFVQLDPPSAHGHLPPPPDRLVPPSS